MDDLLSDVAFDPLGTILPPETEEPKSLVNGEVVDPDAALAEIATSAQWGGCWRMQKDADYTNKIMAALRRYLASGGQQPQWKDWPLGTEHYRWWLKHGDK